VATQKTAGDARKTDRVNVRIPAPGSPTLACIIAARAAGRLAVIANNNPPTDYANQELQTVIAGTDAEQWDYAERDLAVKAGISTLEVKNGVLVMSDTVTFYHPDGEEPPAYRYVVDIMKVMQVMFNAALIFESNDWAGKPLIPDNQPTVNPLARKPKSAKAALASMWDNLGLNAIIADPEYAKTNTSANINQSNPKRLDVRSVFKIAGNTNIISYDLNWGFNFGSAPVAA
jgi:phage tail sheath gpL-like